MQELSKNKTGDVWLWRDNQPSREELVSQISKEFSQRDYYMADAMAIVG